MGKLRRTPFRCRGCSNRFYVYVPREKDEVEDLAEAAENPPAETGPSKQ
jgi:hypothetical protein